MNENQITPEAEEVESQIEGAEAEVEADEDGWPTEWTDAAEESDDNEGETVEEEPKADQPTEEPKAEETKDADKPAETEPEQKPEEQDQFLELKHMDTVRKVNRDEAKVLAQKGLDYDRIPRMLAEKEGISYADAVAKVGVMQQGAQPQQQAQVQQGQPKIPAVDQFVQKYPGVKAEEIPQAVWDEVKRTGDLVGAYENYQNTKVKDDKIASLEQEIETLKQNQKNAARSTGSASSSGKTSGKSLIQQLWDEDDY